MQPRNNRRPERIIQIAHEIAIWWLECCGIAMNGADRAGTNGLRRKPPDVSRCNLMEFSGEFDAHNFFERKPGGHEQDSALARSKIDQRKLSIVDLQLVQRPPHLLPTTRLVAYRRLSGSMGDNIEAADLANTAGVGAIFLVERIDM